MLTYSAPFSMIHVEVRMSKCSFLHVSELAARKQEGNVKIIDRIDEKVVEKTAKRCRERGIVIPTFAQLKDPTKAPAAIKAKLSKTGMNDIDPANLFRITWKNEPKPSGGGLNDG